MDPHSTKRQRIAPPSPTTHPVQAPSFASELSHTHSRDITLTQLPVSKAPLDYNATLSRQHSFSRRHSKDTLFHKDTHHRHLPKQQQIQQQQQQQQQQQKLKCDQDDEWSPLRQAHEEFNQQRLQYLAKQRQLKRQRQLEQQQQYMQMQQLQHQFQQQHLQSQPIQHHQDRPPIPEQSRKDVASPQPLRVEPPSTFVSVQPQPPQFQTPSSSQSSSPVPSEPHSHSHHPFLPSGQQQHQGLRFQNLGNPHNRPVPLHLQPYQQQRRQAPHPTSATFLRLPAPTGAPGVTGNASSMSQHSPYFGRRTQQFSDWLAVKEREKARAENHMTRLRETTSCEHHQQQQQQQQQQQPLSHRAKSQNRSPSGKDNLKRLQQKIQQRRARARATLLYDLHQGVKSVEAQVQKQVEMVLSRLKEAPGSRYAFALTNTFLNTLPSALSQTILPSAISAVAATAATKATNMTALRDYGEHDDDDDDDDDDEDDEDEGAEEGEEDSEEKMWFLWQLQQQQLYQDFCYSRFAGQHQHYSSPPPQWLQQRLHQEQIQNQSAEHLSNELLRTVSIAPPSPSSSSSSSVSSSSPKSSSCSLASTEPSNTTVATSTEPPAGTVHISSKDASVLLSAGSSTTYASAASMVLSAAASAGLATIDSTLPSFLPTVVAPIVCVFSYPTPATSKVTSPQDASSPPPSLLSSSHGDEGPRKENLYESLVRDHSAAGKQHSAAVAAAAAAHTAASAAASTSALCSLTACPTVAPWTSAEPLPAQDSRLIKKEGHEGKMEEKAQLSSLATGNKALLHSKKMMNLHHHHHQARSSRSNGWTKAEREALFLAVTRFRLFGQWTKIKEMMNLHRTEEEIEYEYRRLYVDDDVEDSDQDSSDDEEGGQEQRQQRQGEAEDIQDSSQDGDDEDESDEDESNIDVTKVKKEQVESDGFSSSSSSASAPSSSSASSLSASASTLSGGRGSRIVDGVDLDQLSKKAQREFLRHRALLKRALKQQQQQQPVRWNEREVLVDKRFHLEEIPMHL